ncbi:MAG: DUF4011 domain-containing protein, partial [Pirellulales bacterium]
MPDELASRIAEWRKKLLDTSNRNRLINCKIGRRGAIRIDHPVPARIWQSVVINDAPMEFVRQRRLLGAIPGAESVPERFLLEDLGQEEIAETDEFRQSDYEACLRSMRLEDKHLLCRLSDKELYARLKRFRINAQTSLSEQGVNGLYLAFGLLSWYERDDSTTEILSPLLLVPVQLNRQNANAPWAISLYEEEVVPNRCLQERFQSNFGLRMPDHDSCEIPDDLAWRTEYFDHVRTAIRDYPRWEVRDEAILGWFNYQKLAMWQDLKDNEERILAHDLCRAVAGDRNALSSPDVTLPVPSDFDDDIRPEHLHSILDCDSSQLEAIVATKRGMNLILDGPPGTGKSQTIANVIAEFLADGKTVLFVSEKAAALEVVKRRLDEQNLGDFCLECHSHKASKKQVISELGRCLSLEGPRARGQGANLTSLYARRQELNAYVRALHRVRSALEITAFAAHGRLASLRLGVSSQCPINNVLSIDATQLENAVDAVERLNGCREAVLHHDEHPWRGCSANCDSLTFESDLRNAFDGLRQQIQRVLIGIADLQEIGFPVTAQAFCKKELVPLTVTVKTALALREVPAGWFERNAASVANSFLELERLAREQAQLQDAVWMFRTEATADLPPLLPPSALLRDDPRLSRIGPAGAHSVRNLGARLAQLVDDLASLRAKVDAVAREYASLPLKLKKGNAPGVRELRRHLSLLGLFVAIGVARPSWFDDDQRRLLHRDGRRCMQEMQDAQSLRQELSQRLSERAFGSSGANVAAEGSQFQSFWKRWVFARGPFKAFKERVADVYAGDLRPSTKTVLDDMSRLRRYHRRMKEIEAIEERHQDSLKRAPDGQVDWARMISALEAVNALKQVRTEIPPEWKEVWPVPMNLQQVFDQLAYNMSATQQRKKTPRNS